MYTKSNGLLHYLGSYLYNTSCLCKWWVDGLQYLNGGMFGTDTANHMRCGQNMSKAHSKKHGMVGLRLCDGYI